MKDYTLQVSSKAYPQGQVCTALFGLTPRGLGTALQESLPSYLERLATLHAVSVRALILRVLLQRTDQRAFQTRRQGFAMLLGSSVGVQIAERVAALTGVPQVAGLVRPVLNWGKSPQSLLRAVIAWCPLCLGDWEQADLPIYRPLLWSLRPVTACPFHRVALETQCPGCATQFLQLVYWKWKQYCPRCGQPLTRACTASPVVAIEQLCSDRMAEFLAWSRPGDAALMSRARFAGNVRLAVSLLTLKHISSLVGLDATSISAWCNKGMTPQLVTLLQLSCSFDIPLHYWVTTDIPADVFLRLGKTKIALHLKRTKNRITVNELEQALKTILAGEEKPCLQQVCNQLRVSRRRLNARLPDLAKQIIRAHVDWNKLKRNGETDAR